jgi:hypothetical protein
MATDPNRDAADGPPRKGHGPPPGTLGQTTDPLPLEHPQYPAVAIRATRDFAFQSIDFQRVIGYTWSVAYPLVLSGRR